MYTIWVIEDEDEPVIQVTRVLKDTFGMPQTGTANWAVFRTAQETIDRLLQLRADGIQNCFPDVAIVDVNLNLPSDEKAPMLEGTRAEMRGFVVAAALQSFSVWQTHVVLYTGSPIVKDLKEKYFDIPEPLKAEGVRPLFTIEEKGEAGKDTFPEAVRRWIWRELLPLSERAIRKRGCSGLEIEDLERARAQLLKAAERERLILPDFVSLDTKVQSLVAEYEKRKTANADDHSCLLDTATLAEARSMPAPAERIAMIRRALSPEAGRSFGWVCDHWKSDMKQQAEELSTIVASVLREDIEIARSTLGPLVGSDWFQGLRTLMPFEAGTIERFVTGSGRTIADCVEAAEDMVLLLSRVNHNATLARAFLSISIGDGKTRPATVFAHACHRWNEDYWNYSTAHPTNDPKVRNEYLRAELGLSGDPKLIFPKLELPPPSLERIKEYGAKLNPEYPFYAFTQAWATESSGCRAEWEWEPSKYFRQHWGVRVIENGKAPEDRGRWLLTDWRHLFSPPDNEQTRKSAIAKIIEERQLLPSPNCIEISWPENSRQVIIRFKFAVKDRENKLLDLTSRAGTLTNLYEELFRGWGDLRVEYSTNEGRFSTSFNQQPLRIEDNSEGDCEPTAERNLSYDIELGITNYSNRKVD